MTDGNGNHDENRGQGGEPEGACERDAVTTIAEIRGELKGALAIVAQPPAAMTPEARMRAEGWRGLVGIARELASCGEGNPLVRDNAGILKQAYVDKLNATVLPPDEGEASVAKPSHERPAAPPSALAPSRVETASPAAPPQPPRQADAPEVMPRDEAPDGVDDGDDHDDVTPGFDRDRRFVRRAASTRPLFSQMAERYLAAWQTKSGKDNKDIRIARARCALFVELIGDHPVDTYTGTDLQAYINLLQFWPGDNNKRPKHLTAREIIDDNRDLHLKPLSLNAMREGYVWVVKRVVRWEMTAREYADPFAGLTLYFPGTSAPSRRAQPLSNASISSIFRTGARSGLVDEAMLPLLGHLTGRRLALLVHLTGSDVREKYPGVWVAQTDGIVKRDGRWTRVPYKTDASTGFFVLHHFLTEIGFVAWARSRGDSFLFPQLMGLEAPTKSASSYMRRLFQRAGVKPGTREVFHSLRGGHIDGMRDANIDARDRRLQAGHAIGDDEHDRYGFASISEVQARRLAAIALDPGIDYDVFRDLDFAKMAKKKRTMGRKRKET